MDTHVDPVTQARTRKHRTLVVASSGWWGSVGDDALIRTICTTLREAGADVLVLVRHDHDKWQSVLENTSASVFAPRQFLSLSGMLAIARLNDVYIIGADIMDGGFDTVAVMRRLGLANILHHLGKRVAIINFSFNKQPKAEVLNAFRRLGNKVRYTVRDHRSRLRFEDATGLCATPVADVGFLTRPESSAKTTEFCHWASRMRGDGLTVLMLNTAIVPFRSDPATAQCTPADIAQALGAALVDLEQRHHRRLAIALAPHDFRDVASPTSDVALAAALNERLRKEFGGRLRVVPTPFNSVEMCAMAASADLVVTGRMHLAILSLTAGVVPVSFTYQDKFEGMYEHVFARSADLMLSTQGLMTDPSAIADALSGILARRHSLEAEILATRQKVMKAALGNFSP